MTRVYTTAFFPNEEEQGTRGSAALTASTRTAELKVYKWSVNEPTNRWPRGESVYNWISGIYTAPGGNKLELFTNGNKIESGVTYSVTPASSQNGIYVTIDEDGNIDIIENNWTSDSETFTLKATYSVVDYTVPLVIRKNKTGETTVHSELKYHTTIGDFPTDNVFILYKAGEPVTSGVTYSGSATQNGLALDINSTGQIYLRNIDWTTSSESFTLTANYLGVDYTATYTVKKMPGLGTVLPALKYEKITVLTDSTGNIFSIPYSSNGWSLVPSEEPRNGVDTPLWVVNQPFVDYTTGVTSTITWTKSSAEFAGTSVDPEVGGELKAYKWLPDAPTAHWPRGYSETLGANGAYYQMKGPWLQLYSDGERRFETNLMDYSITPTSVNGLTATIDEKGRVDIVGDNWTSDEEEFDISVDYEGNTYTKTYILRKSKVGDTTVLSQLDRNHIVVPATADGTPYYTRYDYEMNPLNTKDQINYLHLFRNGEELLSGVTYSGSQIKNGLRVTVDPITGKIEFFFENWITNSETFTITGNYSGSNYSQTLTIQKTLEGSSTIIPMLIFDKDTATALADGTGYTIPNSSNGWVTSVPPSPVFGQTLYSVSQRFAVPSSETNRHYVKWNTSAAAFVALASESNITVELTNFFHSFPRAADGSVSSYLGSGTEIHVYEGLTELEYDEIGETPGTWTVTSSVVQWNGVTSSPSSAITVGTITDEGLFAKVGDYSAFDPEYNELDGILYGVFDITGQTASGREFTLQRKQQLGFNIGSAIYRLKTSSPVIYKDSPDAYTEGPHSTVYIDATKTEGGTETTFGYITIRPEGEARGPWIDVNQWKIDHPGDLGVPLSPDDSDEYASYRIELWDGDDIFAHLKDAEDISVVYRGITAPRSATLYLYKWLESSPSSFPSGTSTYTWADGTFTNPGTLNGWSQGIADPAGPGLTLYRIQKTINNSDVTPTDTVTWDTSSYIVLSTSGPAGITVAFSNETHTFPSDSTGAVSSYDNSGTTIQVWEGNTPLVFDDNLASYPSAVSRFRAVGSGTGITVGSFSGTTTTTATVGNHSSATTDTPRIDYSIYVKTFNGDTYLIPRTQTFTKNKTNIAHFLDLSSAVIYKNSENAGTTGTYSSLSISGKRYDGANTTTFGWVTTTPNTTGTESARTNIASSPLVLSPSSGSGVSSYTIKMYDASSGGNLVDSEVVSVVFRGNPGTNGFNALTPIVSNESHGFASDSSGVVSSYTNSGTTIQVREGGTDLIFDGTTAAYPSTAGRFRVVPSVSGVTAGSFSGTGTSVATLANVTAVSSGVDNPKIDFTFYVKMLDGTNSTFVRTQTFSKNKTNIAYYLQLESAVIYKAAPDAATNGVHTELDIQGKKQDGSLTTNFGWVTVTPNTTGVEGARVNTASGATTLSPSNSAGVSSYLIKMYDASSGGNLVDSQTVPIVFKGTDGVAGTSNAVVYLYKRSATSPSGSMPSGTFTYTFSSMVLSGGTLNGWTQTPPANDGNPLWIIAAFASAVGATDSISAGEFTSPVLDSGAGLNQATVYLFIRSATTPTVPNNDIIYTFSDGSTSGSLDGWSRTIPAGTDPVWVITPVALASGATDTITISELAAQTPRVMAQNGVDGIDSIRAELTSETANINAAFTGTVVSFANTGTDITVYEGSVKLDYDGSGATAGKWNVTATGTNVTAGSKSSQGTTPNRFARYADISAITASTGNILFTISGRMLDGTSFSFTRLQTFTRSLEAAPPISAIVSNSVYPVPADSDGNVISYTNSGTTIKVYEGANLLDYDGSGGTAGKWNVTAAGTSITAGTKSSTGTTPNRFATYGVASAMTADTAMVVYTISGRNSAGTLFTFDVVQSFSKARYGVRGSKVFYRDISGVTAPNHNQWSDTQADLAITSQGFTKVTLDAVTLYNQSTGFSGTKYWNGSSWTTVAQVIDGNLLVTGSIAANKLILGDASIVASGSTIKVGDISAATGTFTGNLNVSGSTIIKGTVNASTGSGTVGTSAHIRALTADGSSNQTALVVQSNVSGAWAGYIECTSTAGVSPTALIVNAANAAGGLKVQSDTYGIDCFTSSSSTYAARFWGSGKALELISGPCAIDSGGYITVTGMIRSTGTGTFPTAGSGLETYYSSGGTTGYLSCATRTTGGAISQYRPLIVAATTTDVTQGPIRVTDGSAATPSLSFTSDPDTGIYKHAGNGMAFSAGGSAVLWLDTYINCGQPIALNSGLGTTPALTFSGDGDTGIAYNGSNAFGFRVGGSSAFSISSGALCSFNYPPSIPSSTPSSSSGSGTAGQICWDASYFYVCVSTNSWRRIALSTF